MKATCSATVVEKTLWSISKDLFITELKTTCDIKSFSAFVYNVYKDSYLKQNNWIPENSTLLMLQEEDLYYAPESRFYACCSTYSDIIGTCRITRRIPSFTFPIEDEFKINLNHLTSRLDLTIDDFWHFGRLAIDKERLKNFSSNPNSAKIIMTELLLFCVRTVCSSMKNMLIAETDAKVFRMLSQLGINMEMIGLPKFYMGSFTLPSVVSAKDLLHWSSNTMSIS